MEGFTFTALVTGVICYVLGLTFGWYVNKQNNKKAIQDAYKRGEDSANRVHEAQKQALSEDLMEKLECMKESLVSTYEAYEDAVLSVDQKLSPGMQEKLTLTHSAMSKAQIGYERSGENESKKKEQTEESPVAPKASLSSQIESSQSTKTADSDSDVRTAVEEDLQESPHPFVRPEGDIPRVRVN